MGVASLTVRPGVLLLGSALPCATWLVGGAAKETGAAMTGTGTGSLWALLVPIALAAGSYGVLLSREKDGPG